MYHLHHLNSDFYNTKHYKSKQMIYFIKSHSFQIFVIRSMTLCETKIIVGFDKLRLFFSSPENKNDETFYNCNFMLKYLRSL